MLKKTAIAAGILMSCAAQAQAQAQEKVIATSDKLVDNYRWEIDASAGRKNIDNGTDDKDADKFGIGGTFFFDDVDTTKGPRSEAAFLDHASSVRVGYLYTDLDDIIEDLDGDTYGIDGRYVLGLDSIPLIFEGSWTRQTPEFSDIDTYEVGFGAYLTDTTTVVLTYSTSDIDESDDFDAGDVDTWGITAKHMWILDQGGIEIEGYYGFVDVDCNDCDDPDAYSLDATWYVNNDLGFGVGYGATEWFGAETDTYSVNAEWFVTQQIGLSLEYEYLELDDTDVEHEQILLGARFRF